MDWRVVCALCFVLVSSSSGNVPLMSSGYAKTSYAGSIAPDTYTPKTYAHNHMRSVQPEVNNEPNKFRVVPSSFSDNRLPLMKNPETAQRTSKEVPTGRALSDSNSLTSAIARSFQDVLPSDINSLTSSASTPSYDDDLQKSPLVSEYSYGNNGYYEYPQAQDRYHPQRPYQAGYPDDYYNNPQTGTVSDMGDIPSGSNSIAPVNPMAPANPMPTPSPMGPQPRPADTYQPGAMPYNPPAGYPSYNPYPYPYNPPAPPPPPEEPPEDSDDEDDDSDLDKGVYTHYNIGRKLYYAPLWFSLYFVGYMFVETCKHIWRHKYTYPVRAEDAIGIGRGMGDNSTYLEQVTHTVTKAIEENTKKYHESERKVT